MKVKYEELTSNLKNIEIGIPQGTPLSCSMFNIYFNDAPLVLKYCQMKLFADDAMIHISGRNEYFGELFSKVKVSLNGFVQYLNMCKLKLNTNKTKYMIISRVEFSASDNLIVENKMIQKVDMVK